MAIGCKSILVLLVLTGLFARSAFCHPASSTKMVITQQPHSLVFAIELPAEQLQLAQPEWPVLQKENQAQASALLASYLPQHLQIASGEHKLTASLASLNFGRCLLLRCLWYLPAAGTQPPIAIFSP